MISYVLKVDGNAILKGKQGRPIYNIWRQFLRKFKYYPVYKREKLTKKNFHAYLLSPILQYTNIYNLLKIL